jgi:hypothetical protein
MCFRVQPCSRWNKLNPLVADDEIETSMLWKLGRTCWAVRIVWFLRASPAYQASIQVPYPLSVGCCTIVHIICSTAAVVSLRIEFRWDMRWCTEEENDVHLLCGRGTKPIHAWATQHKGRVPARPRGVMISGRLIHFRHPCLGWSVNKNAAISVLDPFGLGVNSAADLFIFY